MMMLGKLGVKETRRRGTHNARILIAVLVLFGFPGCVNRMDGQKLADSGLSTATTLANYYDTLGQQVVDIVEMEAFSSVLRGFKLEDSLSFRQQMQSTQEALQRRARLARQLAASYQSLKNLSSYDASGEVSNSFDKLSQSLQGIPPLKAIGNMASGAPVNPETLFSQGAGLLAAWKQSRDIQKAVQAVTVALEALNTLFNHELPACQSIAQEHVEKAGVVADELIKKNLVIAWPLLEDHLESIGLKLANPNQQPSDPAVINALAAVVRARVFRLQDLANSAGQSILDALNLQLSNQHQFKARQGISISDVQKAVEKADGLLDEIAKQRQSTKP